MTFQDLHFKNLAQPTEKIALLIDDKEVAFRQLAAQADLFARTLAGLGVVKGDRVSFFMGNRPEVAAFAEERLAERKVPRRWALADEISLTPMAKIDRKALAAIADKILAEEN